MSVINLLTLVEADDLNSDSTEWLALSDGEKAKHIFQASLYMQTRWSCVEVDWEDATTLSDDLKRACAYYADADRLGLLFPALVYEEPRGRLTEETGKVGSLLETKKWSTFGGVVTKSPLTQIDALMLSECTRLSPGSAALVRV